MLSIFPSLVIVKERRGHFELFWRGLKFLTNKIFCVKIKTYPYIRPSGRFRAEKKEIVFSVCLVYFLFGFRGMDVVVAVGAYGKNYALELPRYDQLEMEPSLLKKRFVSLSLLKN